MFVLLTCNRWSGGLHQAIEAKEQLPIQDESVTLATISYQVLCCCLLAWHLSDFVCVKIVYKRNGKSKESHKAGISGEQNICCAKTLGSPNFLSTNSLAS